MNEIDSNEPDGDDIDSESSEYNDMPEVTMTEIFGEFLHKFKPKDIKDISEQISKYVESKLRIEAEYKKHDLMIKEASLRAKSKFAFQFQWIRAILLLATGSAVTYLIINKTFDSAAALFFGGLVAYLFGKEPK
jgi:hypothetical protein